MRSNRAKPKRYTGRAYSITVVFLLLALQLLGNSEIGSIFTLALFTFLTVTVAAAFSDITEALLAGLALSLPLSYLSVFPIQGFLSELSPFFIYLVILTVVLLRFLLVATSFKRQLSWLVLLGTIALIVAVINVFRSPNTPNAIKAFLATTPVFIPLLLTLNQSSVMRNGSLGTSLVKAYVLGALACSIFIVMQWFSANFFGQEIGNIYTRPGRITYGARFQDWSILSGYLASGVACLPYLYRQNHDPSKHLIKYTGLGALLVTALILTGTRTGLFAIFVGLLAVSATALLRKGIIKNILLLGGLAIFAVVAPIALSIMRPSVSHEGFIDSGRIGLWKSWLIEVTNHSEDILLGYAYGSGNQFEKSSGLVTPHNLFIELLLNGGLPLLLYYSGIIFTLFWSARTNQSMLFALTVTVSSTLVSPSVLQARYLPIFIIIALLWTWKSRNKLTSKLKPTTCLEVA